MGFQMEFLRLGLIALVPLTYMLLKKRAKVVEVPTIPLSRYKLLAAIVEQRRLAAARSKELPVILLVAVALAVVAFSAPWVGFSAPSHGVAVVVGLEASDPMNQPPPAGAKGSTRLDAAKEAARQILGPDTLAPGDLSALMVYELTPLSSSLGQPAEVSLLALGDLARGLGGNDPGQAIVAAHRILADAPPAARRVAVLFNSGEGLQTGDPTLLAEPLQTLPRVEGYIVNLGPRKTPLEPYAAVAGWTLMDFADWSPTRIASGSPTATGESLFDLTWLLALAAFALVALVVFKEIRRK